MLKQKGMSLQCGKIIAVTIKQHVRVSLMTNKTHQNTSCVMASFSRLTSFCTRKSSHPNGRLTPSAGLDLKNMPHLWHYVSSQKSFRFLIFLDSRFSDMQCSVCVIVLAKRVVTCNKRPKKQKEVFNTNLLQIGSVFSHLSLQMNDIQKTPWHEFCEFLKI